MNKFAMTAVAALLMATPVMAQTVSGDAEIQSTIEWQNLVNKTAANQTKTDGDVAQVKANSATDAVQAPHAKQAQPETGRYNRMEDYWNDRS